jgi:hypothetical protein
MRPQARTVLAHAPAFGLEFSVAGGGLQRAGRKAGFAVFLGVKSREVLADDFGGTIALDPLRPGIPVSHAAVLVQQVDGVVGDALQEQSQLLFALVDPLFGCLALAQVARDLGKADDLTGRHSDRIDDDVGPETRTVLAHAPAFGLEFSVAGGGLQRAGRKAGFAVFLGVKSREVLADDFGGGVTVKRCAPGFQLVTMPVWSSM